MGSRAQHSIFIAGSIALAVAAAGPASAATDEDQVRAVLDGMNVSYNRTDFGAFASHVCATMLKADGFEAGWYASRKTDGPTQITINSVDVTRSPNPQVAVASVRFQAANRSNAKTLFVEFRRDGAQWKACRYSPARSI